MDEVKKQKHHWHILTKYNWLTKSIVTQPILICKFFTTLRNRNTW